MSFKLEFLKSLVFDLVVLPVDWLGGGGSLDMDTSYSRECNELTIKDLAILL